jgi:hypothetical protein
MTGREERWAIIEESERVPTVINPQQCEIGQGCVITRRHFATLLFSLPSKSEARGRVDPRFDGERRR